MMAMLWAQQIIVTDVGNAVCNWHAFYSKCVYT